MKFKSLSITLTVNIFLNLRIHFQHTPPLYFFFVFLRPIFPLGSFPSEYVDMPQWNLPHMALEKLQGNCRYDLQAGFSPYTRNLSNFNRVGSFINKSRQTSSFEKNMKFPQLKAFLFSCQPFINR